jgi:transcriptional regulator with XRE-family HTH domain
VNLQQIGAAVKQKRFQLGLLQEQVGNLVGVSRVTVNQLENGTLKDLGYAKLNSILEVLGIGLATQEASSLKSGLAVAARSASTSYRLMLSPSVLSEVLRTGVVPSQFQAHLMAFLEETPLPVVVKAIAEAASPDTPSSKIMKNLQHLAKDWHICREVWQH